MTRAEIRDRILEGLNESAAAPAFWSTSEIDDLIQEGAESLSEELATVKRTAFVPIREGAIYYYTESIAKDVMAPYRLWLVSQNRRLRPVTVAELDQRHETWSTVTAAHPEAWFSISWDLFGVWPGATEAGGILRCDYVGWPRTLSDDDDEPESPEAEHDTLVLYGIYEGLLKQWDIARALAIYARFLERIPGGHDRANVELRAMNLRRGASGGFRTGFRG